MQCASMYHSDIIMDLYSNNLLVSGVPPKQPVVSPKSGSIFERELIEQYINEHHKDPISSEPLSIEELIEIKTSPYQPPRQPTLNSIPSLLSSLQNEWDSVALELFQLRKQLEDTRKELSTALYHHDAAVRVASKAIKQRDEARNALQELTISISNGKPINNGHEHQQPSSNENGDIQLNDSTPPDEVSQLITTANEELFALHKAQKQKVNVAIASSLNTIQPLGKKETKPYKKIVASNVVEGKVFITSSTGLTSSYDFKEQSFHKNETVVKNKNISVITSVLYNNEPATLVGTTTGELIINNDVKIGENIHKESIVSVITHPSLKNLFLSFGKDGGYAFHDSNSLTTYFQGKLSNPIVTASIHTDGALVAVGDIQGTISIIDIRNNEIVKTMDTSDSTITDLRFGPNGYWLFAGYTSSNSQFVKVWDLRKDSFETINLTNSPVKLLTDKSAHLLIILGPNSVEVVQYSKKGKEWIGKAVHAVENIDGVLVDGALVDDTVENQIQLALISDSSAVQEYIISP